jgi:hypothetical protein
MLMSSGYNAIVDFDKVVLDSGAKPDCSDSGKIAGDYTSEASYAA